MLNYHSHKHKLFLIVGLILFLVYGFYGELIFAKNGYGFDGEAYATITKNFFESLKLKNINAYYFQRAGIPFVVHLIFNFFHISFSDQNIIHAYQVTNTLFILIAVCFYFKISHFLQLTRNIEIIGFSALFYCFPILKFAMYYPILMDIPAFSIAVIMAYCYLKNNYYLFFLLVFIGSFVYPTFVVLCVLFVFKRPTNYQNKEVDKKSILEIIPYIISWIILPLLLCFIFLFWLDSFKPKIDHFKIYLTNPLYIWFSFILTLTYLLWLNYFPSKNFILKNTIKTINYKSVVLFIVVVILTKYIITSFASSGEVRLTLKDYLCHIVFQAIRNPLNFIVAHVYYFGLFPLLSIFIIKDIKQEIQSFGLGMMLFFSAFIFFSIGSESRQLINYYPFLVLLVLVALNKKWNVSFIFSILFLIASIILSHFWYRINKGLSSETPLNDYIQQFKFPLQRYFMFQGPWVSDFRFKLHLAICAFLLLVLFVIFKKNKWITRKTI